MSEGYLHIMSTIHKSFKIRDYPTQEQRRQFARAEGATRYVHNRVLRAMDEHQKATGGYKSFIDMSREVTQWKRDPETLWLKEVPSTCITQGLRDLQTAFGHFFAKRAQYPKKARKQSGCAIRFQLDQRQDALFSAWAHRQVKIPTMGLMKMAQPERLPVTLPKMITLSRDSAGRYFISFGVEVDVNRLPVTGHTVGVDVGIKDLAA